ncbi:hypothetical protein L6164_016597 [Bauhinia variegata]|uniref:Uncharacterized protein n=1 Tax=Bauhinia variegata TaxID=167791 RepID=A0ACB9NVB3_BAUVA|nr:hypothetical protein L6164_016597 [Bauhinia variegata]
MSTPGFYTTPQPLLPVTSRSCTPLPATAPPSKPFPFPSFKKPAFPPDFSLDPFFCDFSFDAEIHKILVCRLTPNNATALRNPFPTMNDGNISVGWEKVTCKHSKGGLNLKKSKRKNLAILAKIPWGLLHDKDSIWASTFSVTAKFKHFHTLSGFKALKAGMNNFRRGKRSLIQCGSLTKFWDDTWLSSGPIREQIQGPLNHKENTFMVKDLIDSLENWDFNKISIQLPQNIRAEIEATAILPNVVENDVTIWAPRPTGIFSVKSTYDLLSSIQKGKDIFKKVWNSPSHSRIQHFLWKCAHNALPVSDLLLRKHNLQNSSY